MSPNGHLENETWVHSGCWLRKGLGKLHDVGKLCPKKGENLVFQGGTEFPVLQTHPFKAIRETAQSLSRTCCWNYSLSPSQAFWLCLSLQCWPCRHFLLSAPLSTAQFEGEDLWSWTREASLQNLKHFCIFLWTAFTLSQPQRFPSTAFLSPLPQSPNDLAGGDLGQEEGLSLHTMKPPVLVWVCRKAVPNTFHLYSHFISRFIIKGMNHTSPNSCDCESYQPEFTLICPLCVQSRIHPIHWRRLETVGK